MSSRKRKVEEEEEEEGEEDIKGKKENKKKGKENGRGKKKEDDEEEDEEEEEEQEDKQPRGKEKEKEKDQPNGVKKIDPTKRRETRAGYRKLELDLDANKDKYTEPNCDDLHKKLDEGNSLYKGVQMPLEASRDSKFLLNAATLAQIQAQRLRTGFVSLETRDITSRFSKFLGQKENSDWSKLSNVAMKYTSAVPAVTFMLGPMSIEHRVVQRKVNSKITKDAKDLKLTKKLTVEEIQQNENETPKNVLEVEKILKQHKGAICFFILVINPESFAQTIENIFYLSFLIRDGKVKMEINKNDGQPYIEVVPPSEQMQGKDSVKRQLIVEMTMEQWRTLINIFDIKKSMIPTRNPKII